MIKKNIFLISMAKYSLHTFLMIGCSFIYAKNAPLKSTTPDTLVLEVMKQQYGNTYNKESKCWEYSLKTEESPDEPMYYCMTPSSPKLIDIKNGQRIYISTEDGAAKIIGFFILEKNSNESQWRYLIKNKGKDFTISAGFWSVTSPTLVKLSHNDDYGWLLKTGGDWRGLSTWHYSLLFPKKGKIIDIINVVEINEDDQAHVNHVEFVALPNIKGFFPMRVKKIKVDTEEEVSSELIQFNLKTFMYKQ